MRRTTSAWRGVTGEGAHGRGRAPEAERAEAADRRLADADDGEQAVGARCSSALTGRPAARKRRHARDAHVGAGDDGDGPSVGRRRLDAVEHVEAPPAAVAAEGRAGGRA